MKQNAKQSCFFHTPLGVRSVYDSVSFCNRCGMCAAFCPSYALDPKESNSPRARNQVLRLFLEGKLKKKKFPRREIISLLTACTLCGRCSRMCPGQIPTAQHMVQLRRLLRINVLPLSLHGMLRLHHLWPWLFALMVRLGLLGQRLNLLSWGADIPGLGWLKHLCEILPVHLQKPFRAESQTRPTLIYLPSMEAQFFLPDLARTVYQTAAKKHRVCVWTNTASGLFEYLYGDITYVRKILRGLIVRHAQTAGGRLPLLTDSIDVYNFFQQSPQLFEGFPAWVQKAKRFASHVRFVTDVMAKKPSNKVRFPTPVLLMSSGVLSDQSAAQLASQQILHTLFKRNLVQCDYKCVPAVPAGYGFIKATRAPVYQMQAVRTVAKHQVQTVFVLSALAALEFGFYVRHYYPTARVSHLAELNG